MTTQRFDDRLLPRESLKNEWPFSGFKRDGLKVLKEGAKLTRRLIFWNVRYPNRRL